MHSDDVSVCKNDEITIKKQKSVVKNALFAFPEELFLRRRPGRSGSFCAARYSGAERGAKTGRKFSAFPASGAGFAIPARGKSLRRADTMRILSIRRFVYPAGGHEHFTGRRCPAQSGRARFCCGKSGAGGRAFTAERPGRGGRVFTAENPGRTGSVLFPRAVTFFFDKAARFFAFFFVICYNAIVAGLCRFTAGLVAGFCGSEQIGISSLVADCREASFVLFWRTPYCRFGFSQICRTILCLPVILSAIAPGI